MVTTRAGVELSSVEYRPEADCQRFVFDPSTTEPSLAVVGALAEVREEDPVTIEPLTEWLDPDALDTIVGGGDEAAGPTTVTVTVGDVVVTVSSAGVVTFVPVDADPADGGETHH